MQAWRTSGRATLVGKQTLPIPHHTTPNHTHPQTAQRTGGGARRSLRAHPPPDALPLGCAHWSARQCRCRTAALRCQARGAAGGARRRPPCNGEWWGGSCRASVLLGGHAGRHARQRASCAHVCLACLAASLHLALVDRASTRQMHSLDLQALAASPNQRGRPKVAVRAAARRRRLRCIRLQSGRWEGCVYCLLQVATQWTELRSAN